MPRIRNTTVTATPKPLAPAGNPRPFPCKRCMSHFNSWKQGETVDQCCEIQSGSGKCHRCAGRNGACIDMPQKYRNDCLALAQEIASANPNLNRIKALQIICKKACRDVPSRPVVATTRVTRSAATAPKHRLIRAREILAAQVQLDIANSLHNISSTLAFLASSQFTPAAVTGVVRANGDALRACPVTWTAMTTAVDTLAADDAATGDADPVV